MEDLYEKFRDDLKKGAKDMYYDEMELLDIFDNAGDLHDDYVCMEALALGARYFPDSDELAQRKAIFLMNIDYDAFIDFMNGRKTDTSNTLWEILHLRANLHMGDPESENPLDKIVEMGLEDDESIIQFVALVKQIGAEKWMYENLPAIRKKCSYVDNLLYEIARTTDTPKWYPNAIELMEEATENDPFNLDYWTLLADLQNKVGQIEEALVSLDYAKAIDPNCAEPHALEGYIRLDSAIMQQSRGADVTPQMQQALDCLIRARDLGDMRLETKRNIMLAYFGVGQTDDYNRSLAQCFEMSCENGPLFADYVINNPGRTAVYVATEKFVKANLGSEEALLEVCRKHLSRHIKIQQMVLEWYDGNYSLSDEGNILLFETYYHLADWAACNRMLEKCGTFANPYADNLLYLSPYIASVMLVSQDFTRANEYSRHWLSKIPKMLNDYAYIPLELRGATAILMGIIQLLTTDPNPEPGTITAYLA